MTDRPGKPPPAFLELRGVALHPAHNGRMRHRQAALGHHLHQVTQTDLEPEIPANAQDDDFAVEVATLEQLLHDLQLAHCRPQLVQHTNLADPTAPFAPEPLSELAVLRPRLVGSPRPPMKVSSALRKPRSGRAGSSLSPWRSLCAMDHAVWYATPSSRCRN